MAFKEGNKYGTGRPPGSENRLTRAAKYHAMKLLREYEKIGWAKLTEKGDVKDLISLIKTLLPKDFTIDHSGSVELKQASINIDGKEID